MAEDLEQRFIDRLRSLPIPRSSVLAGRAFADTAILALSLGVASAIGFAVGFRLHGSALDGLAAFGLVIAFGFAFEWVFITLGLFAGNGQAAQGMGMIVFPFAFISSAYVPVSTMPGWLQVFAKQQPLTYMVDGPRAHARAARRSAAWPPKQLLRDPSAALDVGDPRHRRAARDRQVPARLTGTTSTKPRATPDREAPRGPGGSRFAAN
jgi:ABC transporter DrrB family efflux protein